MRRLACPEGQNHLWPAEVMASLSAHAGPASPQPLPPLPFPRKREVDMSRAASILDTEETTVRRLLKLGKINSYQIKPSDGRLKPIHRIHYDSLVAYCDGLRLKYLLPARPRVSTRPHDVDVLPFPAAESMSTTEVAEHLDVRWPVVKGLIESGDLAAYQLIPSSKSPWRIHRPSAVAYLLKLRAESGVDIASSPSAS